MLAEEGTIEAAELPGTVQALLAARLDSLEPHERQLVQQAAVVGPARSGRARSTPVARDAGFDLHDALTSLQEKDLVVPSTGSQLAGEQEYAFKHVLIRDVAYGMLPKAVRSAKHFEVGRVHRGARGRPHATRWSRCSPSTTAAPRSLGGGVGRSPTSSCSRSTGRRSTSSRRRATRPRSCTRTPRPSSTTRPRATSAARTTRRRSRGSTRSRATSRCAWAAWTRPSRCGRSASSSTARRRTCAGWATCTARSAPALWHKGERKQALDHYQKGTNLLKDGPPCLELVRLYEEAAWLYMHAGDNMLAIYASEKALRLAERLGETRAASRAHGIFGRVFGRIGDSAKARENLERSVELARGSDEGETIRALLALGNHLEISDADYDARGRVLHGGARDRPARGRPARAGRAARGARARSPSTAPTGRPSRPSPRTAPSWPSARASSGSCASRTRSRGLLRWRERRMGRRRAARSAAPPSWPTRSAGRRSASRRCSGWPPSCATGATSATPRPCSAQALDVCERAGLIAQSIQAMSSRALILALGGRMEQAREAAVRGGRPGRPAPLPRRAGGRARGPGRHRRGPRQGQRAARAGGARVDRPRPPARRRPLPARARQAAREARRPADDARCSSSRRGARASSGSRISPPSRARPSATAASGRPYCVWSAPTITTTDAFPAERLGVRIHRLDACDIRAARRRCLASRSAPSANRTIDVVRCWSIALATLPRWKPADSTSSPIWAARPGHGRAVEDRHGDGRRVDGRLPAPLSGRRCSPRDVASSSPPSCEMPNAIPPPTTITPATISAM